MLIRCGACGRDFPRVEFVITTSESVFTPDGRPTLWARHKKCGMKTIWPHSMKGALTSKMSLSR